MWGGSRGDLAAWSCTVVTKTGVRISLPQDWLPPECTSGLDVRGDSRQQCWVARLMGVFFFLSSPRACIARVGSTKSDARLHTHRSNGGEMVTPTMPATEQTLPADVEDDDLTEEEEVETHPIPPWPDGVPGDRFVFNEGIEYEWSAMEIPSHREQVAATISPAVGRSVRKMIVDVFRSTDS